MRTDSLLIAGIDEVGRGPLAGPVVAAAVILDPHHPIEGLTDSKLLTPLKREKLAQAIQQHALAYHIAQASVEEIEQLNILQATLLAMKRAIEGLPLKPHEIWVDGRDLPNVDIPGKAIIEGDLKHANISAASILAKVARDAMMVEYGKLYPGYGFEQHKGYGTVEHIAAIHSLGVLPIHRKTFAPIRDIEVLEA